MSHWTIHPDKNRVFGTAKSVNVVKINKLEAQNSVGPKLEWDFAYGSNLQKIRYKTNNVFVVSVGPSPNLK